MSMREVVGRARAFARLRLGLFPFTLPGLVTLAGAALSLAYYGVRRLDLLLLVVGAVGLTVCVLALVTTVIGAVGLRLHLRTLADGAPLELACGAPSLTGFSLPRLWFLPLCRVGWSWVEPGARVSLRPEGGRLHEEVVPLCRARAVAVVRRVEVSDAFGLTRVAFRVREPRELRVLPATGALRSVHVVRSIASGEDIYDPAGRPEGERVDTRAYADGDPTRLILWKVYARAQKLVVRTPERAVSAARKTIAYLVAGEGDEPAAGAARVAVESGALGARWVLGADGVDFDATSPKEALELLARSAGCPPSQRGKGLGPFLERAAKDVAGRAVVFVPGRPGPWLERACAAARARAARAGGAGGRAPIEFVVCTDGIAREARRSLLARLAFAPAEDPGPARTPVRDLAAVVAALRAARAPVLVIDRRAGEAYEGGLFPGEGSRPLPPPSKARRGPPHPDPLAPLKALSRFGPSVDSTRNPAPAPRDPALGEATPEAGSSPEGA